MLKQTRVLLLALLVASPVFAQTAASATAPSSKEAKVRQLLKQ